MRRRDILALTSGSISIAVAGCLGGDDDGEDTDTDETDETDDPGENGDDPAVFDVGNLDPTSATTVIGETVSVTADVTNTGDLSATKSVELRLDGETVASDNLELDGGQSDSVSFDADTADLAAGEYTHSVWTEDDEQQGTLTLQTPATFDVSNLEPADATAMVGETLDVSAEITNSGDVDGTKAVELRLDDQTLASEDLTLESDASESVSFEVDTGELAEGTYEHSIWTEDDEESGSLTIELPDSPADVELQDKTIDGLSITVESVRMDEGGFLTIHDSSLLDGEAVASVIGVTDYIDAGSHSDVVVEFEELLWEGDTLIAMPHRDTNDNQEYDFVESGGDEDGAYMHDGDAVTDSAEIEVELPPTVEEAVTEANVIIEDVNEGDPSIRTLNGNFENVDPVDSVVPVEADTVEEAAAEAERLRGEQFDTVEEQVFDRVPREINARAGFELVDPDDVHNSEDAREEADGVSSIEEAAEALRNAADLVDAIEDGLNQAADILDSAYDYPDGEEPPSDD